jgi:hypothetical protein
MSCSPEKFENSSANMRFPGIPRLCKKSSFFSGEIFGFVK